MSGVSKPNHPGFDVGSNSPYLADASTDNVRVALRSQPNTGIPPTNLAVLLCKERFIRFKQVALACPVIEPFEPFEKTQALHIFSNTYAE